MNAIKLSEPELKRVLIAIIFAYIPMMWIVLEFESYSMAILCAYYVTLANGAVAKVFLKEATPVRAILSAEALRISSFALLANYFLSSHPKQIALEVGIAYLVLSGVVTLLSKTGFYKSVRDEDRFDKYSLVLVSSMLLFFVTTIKYSSLSIYLVADVAKVLAYISLSVVGVSLIFITRYFYKNLKECRSDTQTLRENNPQEKES